MKRNRIARNLLLAAAVLFVVPCSFAAEAPHPAPSLQPAPAVAAPALSPQAAQAAPEVMARILATSTVVAPVQFQCPQLPPSCCIAFNGHCYYCTAYDCELP